MIKVEFYPWAQAKAWAKPIRMDVFVQEQHIDEAEEWDEHDESSLHGIAWLDGAAVACIRLLPEGKIGRLAVLKAFRRRGVARALMQETLNKAREARHNELQLSAQVSAMALYQEFGFIAFGEPHFEVNIPHQWMRLSINS